MILTISLAKHQYARGVYYTAEQGCSQILYHGRATFCSAVRCVAERDASRAIWATLGATSDVRGARAVRGCPGL